MNYVHLERFFFCTHQLLPKKKQIEFCFSQLTQFETFVAYALFTGILFYAFMTDITLDFTTPFEFTSALPFLIELMDIMAAATAQEITTVESVCGEIAWPINGAQ